MVDMWGIVTCCAQTKLSKNSLSLSHANQPLARLCGKQGRFEHSRNKHSCSKISTGICLSNLSINLIFEVQGDYGY